MTDGGTATVARPTGGSLRLRAETVEDLVVFSAVLQDAVTIAADMAWRPGERRFALMLNRYLWEEDAEGNRPSLHRVRCGLHFDGVLQVTTRDISQKAKAKPLELLALHGEVDDSGGGSVYLLFAGGGVLRLVVECIDAYLSDTGEPWICKHRPSHGA